MTGMMDEFKLYDPDGNLVDLGLDQGALDQRRREIDWDEKQWKVRLWRWEWRWPRLPAS